VTPTITRTLSELRHRLEEARLKLGSKMRTVGRLIPAVSDFPAFWSQQVGQYPPKGPAGISYFKGVVDADIYVDCLLYRDKKGKLIGVLNHYAFDMPPYESKGNINVMVDPEHQGEGIGKLLLKDAMKRWDVNLAQQNWTPSGDKLRQSIQRSDETEWLVWERGQTEKDAWRIRALNPDDARDVYREQFGSRSDAALSVKPAPAREAPKPADDEPSYTATMKAKYAKLGKKAKPIKLRGFS
jgi:GNAT superfamily N-acetyltransferase